MKLTFTNKEVADILQAVVEQRYKTKVTERHYKCFDASGVEAPYITSFEVSLKLESLGKVETQLLVNDNRNITLSL